MDKVKEFVIKINEDPTRITSDADGCLKVSGNLVVNLAVEVQVKYLKLGFRGDSRCEWTEGCGKSSNRVSSLDSLFEEERALIPSGPASTTLTPGTYVYPFVFQIRTNRHLPTTFVGKYGFISYKLAAQLETEGDMLAQKSWAIECPIIVFNPVKMDVSKLLGSTDFNREPSKMRNISVRASADKTYVTLHSGEKLTVTMSVTNTKSSAIRPVVCLEECVTFSAPTGKTRKVVRTLCKTSGNLVQPLSARASSGKCLPLPNCLPATGEVCEVTKLPKFKVVLDPIQDVITGTIESTANISVIYDVSIAFGSEVYYRSSPIQIGAGMLPGLNSICKASTDL